jgi:hypothetical protein
LQTVESLNRWIESFVSAQDFVLRSKMQRFNGLTSKMRELESDFMKKRGNHGLECHLGEETQTSLKGRFV